MQGGGYGWLESDGAQVQARGEKPGGGGGGGVLPYGKVRDARRPFRGQNLEFWYRLRC